MLSLGVKFTKSTTAPPLPPPVLPPPPPPLSADPDFGVLGVRGLRDPDALGPALEDPWLAAATAAVAAAVGDECSLFRRRCGADCRFETWKCADGPDLGDGEEEEVARDEDLRGERVCRFGCDEFFREEEEG